MSTIRLKPFPLYRFDNRELGYVNNFLDIRDKCPDELKEDMNKAIDALLFMHYRTDGVMGFAYRSYLDVKRAKEQAFPDIGGKNG